MDGLLLTLRVVVSLAAVLGALWYVQRRLSRGSARQRKNEAITVLGRQGLGQKAQLVLAEVDGTRYVLGVTEKGVSLIDANPAPRRGPTAVAAKPETQTDGTVTDFDSVLAASAPVDPAPLRRPRNNAKPGGALAGSILSPTTWRQTADVIRQAR